MEPMTKINAAQYEVLNMLSCISSPQDLADFKRMVVQFLNSRLQNELERLWQDGTLTEEKMTAWGKEHMRTPYK